VPRSIVKEVEHEYGQSFWDVVRGFASDGHSIHATATLLGYSSDTPFRRMIQRHGVQIEFASAQESVFQVEARIQRRGKCTDRQRDGAMIASLANPNYKSIEVLGIIDTLAGHARRVGLSRSTVYKRYARRPDDLEYIFSKSMQYINPPKRNGWGPIDFSRKSH
jgi:hypothetical protein